MSELLLTVMQGARRVMAAQAINANNLANVSTDGFRAELVHIGGLAEGDAISSTPDLRVGTVRTTGNALDVALTDQGWIAIQTPEGTEGYSRRGDLHVDAFGQLVNGIGQPILGNGGPIALPPFQRIDITSDGSIAIVPAGAEADTLAVVDRIKLVNPDPARLVRGEDGTLRMNGGAQAVPDPLVSIQSGSLEGSNVNAVGEMLKMIDLARQFEAQVKLMRTAEKNSSDLATVLRLN
ncbi:MAG TPA: flagellar basal body rod protein FlgF [Hyphomicrobiales bacterium]|nr:flagellar basal body rod protein FlgF [Hyphomicrobiales bacterium]